MKTSSSIIVAVFFCVLFANFVDAFYLQNEYTITPDDNSSDQLCANCLTLTQFALNTSYYLRDNTTLSLQPGNHTLQSSLEVSNIDTFTMHHIGHLHSSIQCKGSNELMFENVQSIHISNLNFTSCFNTRVVCVNSFSLSNTSFHGSWLVTSGTGLELIDVNALLVNCLFTMFYYGIYRSVLTFGYTYSYYNNSVEHNIVAQKWIGGAMVITHSNVTIANSHFVNNRAQLGGAIYAENESNINILDKTLFELNYAMHSDPNIVAAGGALYAAHNCSVAIYDTYFTQNQVYFGYRIGGAVTVYKSALLIERSTFTKNNAEYGGFAFLLESTAEIQESALDNSKAEELGGVLFLLNSNVTLKKSNASGNNAARSGGVIYLENSQVQIQICNFNNNFVKAGRGGVMFAIRGSQIFQIISSTFDGNYARFGGSLYIVGSILEVKDSYFINNRVDDYGGVLYISSFARLYNESIYVTGFSLKIRDSCIANNQAQKDGGAIYLTDDYHLYHIFHDETNFEHVTHSLLEIQNSSFANNQAHNDGGVLYQSKVSSNIQINQCSFLNNLANKGGVLYSDVSNTIIIESNNKYIANKAYYIGAVMYIYNNQLLLSRNTHIQNNEGILQGVVVLYETNANFSGTTKFYKNNGTSLSVIGCRISLTGKFNFTGNVQVGNKSNNLYMKGGAITCFQSEISSRQMLLLYYMKILVLMEGQCSLSIAKYLSLETGLYQIILL